MEEMKMVVCVSFTGRPGYFKVFWFFFKGRLQTSPMSGCHGRKVNDFRFLAICCHQGNILIRQLDDGCLLHCCNSGL